MSQTTVAKIKRFVSANKLIYSLLYPYIIIRKLTLKLIFENKKKHYSSFFNSVKGGSVFVDLPDFEGSFEIYANSHILRRILIEKSYEKVVAAASKKYITYNRDAIDIGSNSGFYTVLFAKNISRENKVLAIEPVPKTVALLKKNITSNNVSEKVILYSGVAADHRSEYSLNTIENLEEYSSLGTIPPKYSKGMEIEKFKVNGDTIDNLVKIYNLNPAIIKIDTEGAEKQIIKGSLKTIKKFKPTIIFESKSPKQVIEILKKYKYTIEKLDSNEEFLALPTISN